MFYEPVNISSLSEIHVDLQCHHHLQFASKPKSPIPSSWKIHLIRDN